MPVSNRDRTSERRASALQPYWQSECGRAVVYVGDCRDVMSRASESQFHAIVTDPPYGLEFMGKEWDAPWKNNAGFNGSQSEDTTGRGSWQFGGTPSSKARPCYGSNSKRYQEWFQDCAEVMLRVAKPGAHLLSFGGTRMWHRAACAVEDAGWEIRDTIMWVYGSGFPKGCDIGKAVDQIMGAERTKIGTRRLSSAFGGNLKAANIGTGGYGFKDSWETSEPATEAGAYWDGWNTALKPALEPIIVARKPFSGSAARNALEHGCGPINVGACLVGDDGGTRAIAGSAPDYTGGRWPTNLIHDGGEEVLDLLRDGTDRIFYCAKISGSDRPHGKSNIHPTVKPLDLMRYLVRLVCLPGGVVLDPFMGSGSTGCAAVLEGMRFVGVEQSQEYADIAVGRLKLALAERRPEETPRAWSAPAPRTDGAPPPARRLH